MGSKTLIIVAVVLVLGASVAAFFIGKRIGENK